MKTPIEIQAEREMRIAIAYYNWRIIQNHKHNRGEIDWTDTTWKAFKESSFYKKITEYPYDFIEMKGIEK